MMKPYFQDEAVTIYHADWRTLLPSLSVDAVVTDQPFGTGWLRGGQSVGVFQARGEKAEWDVFSTSWVDATPLKFWVAFAPNSRECDMRAKATARVWWRKTNPRPNAPVCEPIFMWPIFLPEGLQWVGYNGDTPFHPCQKPVELMVWLLQFCDPRWVVCDPFMGSGTTLRAAKDLGRKAIGIEINEVYCEIAAKRMGQEVFNFDERK